MSLRLSIIVPTYNRRDLLERTLRLLLAQSVRPEDFEVIVVADGCTDSTVPFLRSVNAPNLTYLTQSNRGQSAARNAAARIARGDLLLFVDDDMLSPPDLAEQHLQAHARAGSAHVVCGPVSASADSVPTAAAWSFQAWVEAYVKRLSDTDRPLTAGDIWVCTNTSVARELFLVVGGYDESLRKTHEDAELALRLMRHGARFVFAKHIIGEHVYTKTSDHVVRTDAPHAAREDVRLALRYREYFPFSTLYAWSRRGRLMQSLFWTIAHMPDSIEFPLAVVNNAAERGKGSVLRSIAMRSFRARITVAGIRGLVNEVGGWSRYAKLVRQIREGGWSPELAAMIDLPSA